MKKLLITTILSLITFIGFSQSKENSINDFNYLYDENGIIWSTKLYVGDNWMVSEKIFEYDNKSISELKQLVKNWGGEKFKDFSKVLTNETEDQLVIRYRFGSGVTVYSPEQYIRIIVDLKENKIRIRLFDEDNNTFFIFFKKGWSYTSINDLCCLNSSGNITSGKIKYQNILINKLSSILENNDSINEYIINNSNLKNENDW